MERLLITGGSGFLGRRAAEYLASYYEVEAPARGQLDFTDESSVRAFFSSRRPHFVLHCGALSDVGQCERAPGLSYRVNVLGPLLLARACAAQEAKLVFCSSDQVYWGPEGAPEGGPWHESAVCRPRTVYGRHKLLAEQVCMAAAPGTVCLRLSWMYDVSARPGEHGDFARSLLAAAHSGEPWALPARDMRCITDVWAVVENLPSALALPGGAWNFGSPNPGGESTLQLARRALEALGAPPGLAQVRPAPPRRLCMADDQLRRAGILLPGAREGLLRALCRSGA